MSKIIIPLFTLLLLPVFIIAGPKEVFFEKLGQWKMAKDLGHPRLYIQFLRPSKRENRVISFENHKTSYKATREITTQNNRFFSVRPLHRQKNYRFITVAFPYRSDKMPDYSAKVLSESERYLKLGVHVNQRIYRLSIDFASKTVVLVK